MAELRSAIFWVLNCPIYLLRCYTTDKVRKQEREGDRPLFLLL
ncbi:MAG: hypothetical protein ACK54J_18110 [Pseudanabaena sp.]